jgi:ribosomal protein L40E
MAMNKYTELRWERIDENICTQCGVREPIDGQTYCDPCLEVRLDRLKYLHTTRAQSGFCRLHGRPVDTGTRSCKKCKEIWRMRGKLVKENRKVETHVS